MRLLRRWMLLLGHWMLLLLGMILLVDMLLIWLGARWGVSLWHLLLGVVS